MNENLKPEDPMREAEFRAVFMLYGRHDSNILMLLADVIHGKPIDYWSEAHHLLPGLGCKKVSDNPLEQALCQALIWDNFCPQEAEAIATQKDYERKDPREWASPVHPLFFREILKDAPKK
jgi:hypothetical protein